MVNNLSAPTCRGFTLVELLIVIAIISILAMIAMPSINEYLLGQRIRATSYGLQTSLAFARNEAIKRNQSVSLVPNGTDWSNGWNVVTTTVPSTTLQTEAARNGITVSAAVATSPATPNTTGFNYLSNGRTSVGAPLTFTISANGQRTRCIRIDTAGSTNARTLSSGSC